MSNEEIAIDMPGDLGPPNETMAEINLSNNINGVEWNGHNEEKRTFGHAFIEVLKTCDLTGRAKLIIKSRYVKLFEFYKRKYRTISILNMSSRVIISFGSILIPALISLDNELTDRSDRSLAIYYITFSLSLVITLTNAMSELFQFSKKYYTYTLVKENMKTEGWTFLTLSGSYKHYNDHSECWRKFMYRIEKLNISTIQTNLVLSNNASADETKQSEKFKFLDNDSEVSNKVLYLS